MVTKEHVEHLDKQVNNIILILWLVDTSPHEFLVSYHKLLLMSLKCVLHVHKNGCKYIMTSLTTFCICIWRKVIKVKLKLITTTIRISSKNSKIAPVKQTISGDMIVLASNSHKYVRKPLLGKNMYLIEHESL